MSKHGNKKTSKEPEKLEEKRKHKQIKTLIWISFTEKVLIYMPNRLTVFTILEVMESSSLLKYIFARRP